MAAVAGKAMEVEMKVEIEVDGGYAAVFGGEGSIHNLLLLSIKPLTSV